MQHIFIINPVAGRVDSSQILKEEITSVFDQLNMQHSYEIFITECVKSAENYARMKSENLETPTVFYACGGDGTCNEVLNGIMGAKNAILGIIPVGSCNDFLKVYQKRSRFREILKTVTGKIEEVDVLQVNDRYCLNVFNVGYDANVNWDCNQMSLKNKNIKKAYRKAISRNLIWHFKHKATFKTSEEKLYDGSFLLMTAANGQYYGNGIKCAPLALIDDGLLEVAIIKPVSRLQFIKLFKFYRRGEHLSNEKIKNKIVYARLKEIDIDAPKDLCVCIDGEIFHWRKINVKVVPKGIKLMIPTL